MRTIFIRGIEMLSWFFIVITILVAIGVAYGTETQTHAIGLSLYQNFDKSFSSPESAMGMGRLLSILIGLLVGYLVSVLIFGVLFILLDIREFTKRTAEKVRA